MMSKVGFLFWEHAGQTG